MSTNKQALRKLAVDAKELAIIKRYTKGIEAQKKFIAAMTPALVLALLDELEARPVALPPLNEALIAILGRPNFTCAHLAELMRNSGSEIKRKAEHEQAAVIHWLLGIYLEHGDKWESVAKADIQARAAGITVKGE